MMRLVWPDQEQMPRSRNGHSSVEETQTDPQIIAPVDEPNAAGPAEDGISADPSVPASSDAASNELEDGSIAPVEASSDDDDADEGVLPEINLSIIEALLFSTHHPLTPARIAELLEIKSTKPVKLAVQSLNDSYIATARSFRVEQVAGGYQLLSLPEYGDYLKRLHQKEIDTKLTKAALETLAIIAYKQPILRADVEAIRGVACGETIRSLMEKHLVKIAGRAEEPGRPILYGTTKRFLELFGLNSTKDLPQSDDSILPPPKEQLD